MRVPVKLSRAAGSLSLKASANAPSLLFGAGIAGFIGTTVLASRATLKLEEALADTQRELERANQAHSDYPEKYSEQDLQEDRVKIYAVSVGRIARLYGPAILLGGASIYCLSRSHNLLMERNEALAAAYVAVDQAFKEYRGRVIDKYGEDEDRDFMYGGEQIEGKPEKLIGKTPPQYSRFFDELCSPWERNPEYNLAYLRGQQNWFNDKLTARGHVFLNEVYDALGIPQTSAGQVVGWLREGPNSAGYIDFGIWDSSDPRKIDFVNGREQAILLDFNVDGPILNLLGSDEDGS